MVTSFSLGLQVRADGPWSWLRRAPAQSGRGRPESLGRGRRSIRTPGPAPPRSGQRRPPPAAAPARRRRAASMGSGGPGRASGPSWTTASTRPASAGSLAAERGVEGALGRRRGGPAGWRRRRRPPRSGGGRPATTSASSRSSSGEEAARAARGSGRTSPPSARHSSATEASQAAAMTRAGASSGALDAGVGDGHGEEVGALRRPLEEHHGLGVEPLRPRREVVAVEPEAALLVLAARAAPAGVVATDRARPGGGVAGEELGVGVVVGDVRGAQQRQRPAGVAAIGGEPRRVDQGRRRPGPSGRRRRARRRGRRGRPATRPAAAEERQARAGRVGGGARPAGRGGSASCSGATSAPPTICSATADTASGSASAASTSALDGRVGVGGEHRAQEALGGQGRLEAETRHADGLVAARRGPHLGAVDGGAVDVEAGRAAAGPGSGAASVPKSPGRSMSRCSTRSSSGTGWPLPRRSKTEVTGAGSTAAAVGGGPSHAQQERAAVDAHEHGGVGGRAVEPAVRAPEHEVGRLVGGELVRGRLDDVDVVARTRGCSGGRTRRPARSRARRRASRRRARPAVTRWANHRSVHEAVVDDHLAARREPRARA